MSVLRYLQLPIARFTLAAAVLCGGMSPGWIHAQSLSLHLGDIDDDGVVNVRDIARVVEHLKGTTPLDESHAVIADVTKDGAVNQADVDELIKEVLETRTPENLPLSSVRFTSPAAGEGDVSVNRETIVHFTVPLAINATLDTSKFFAEFAGRKVLSRVEISSDRKKATLFYLEPLPANSRIKVTFDGSGLEDLLGRPFDGNGNGLEASALEPRAEEIYRMSFDTHTSSAIPSTGITGRVLQAAPEGSATPPEGYPNVGIPGVTITVDGQEQSLRTTTDAQGWFTLTPCPSGVFFVHIDGRTSPLSNYPGGRYFPNVGKKWEAIAGKMDNPSGQSEDSQRGIIYLPCVCPSTLQPVSLTQATTVGFPQAVLTANPQLTGTSFTFPANTAFSDDGSRGGSLGPVPVPADRLPSPLPPGLRLPFVFSLQTSGPTNFERPVAVTLPNLPDPLTGYKPVPGEKTALVAFNHDTGQWEVVGPMTVTADGNFMKSDPGVGLRQPGWGGGTPGGTAPGTAAEGGAERPCDEVNDTDALSNSTNNNWMGAMKAAAGAFDWLYGKGFGLVDQDLAKGAGLAKNAIGIGNNLDKLLAGRTTTKSLEDLALDLKDALSQRGSTNKAIDFLKDAGDAVAALLPIADLAKAVEDSKDPWKHYRCCLDTGRPCGVNPQQGGVDPISDTDSKNAEDMYKAANSYKKAVEDNSGSWTALGGRISVIKSKLDEIEADPVNALSNENIVQTAGAFGEYTDVLNEFSELAKPPTIPTLAIEAVKAGESAMTFRGRIFSKIRREHPQAPAHSGQLFCSLKVAGFVDRFVSTTNSIVRIVAPDSFYILSVYDAQSRKLGYVTFSTPGAGARFEMPPVMLLHDSGEDFDGDGLSSDAEVILGTSPTNPDTDADGVSDGAELKNGSDPLSGLAVSSGVIARAQLSGNCIDIASGRDMLAAACGTEGVYILGVRQGLTPTRLAQITTAPNAASTVAISSNLLAIGLGGAGTMIVDISTPDAPQFLRLIKIGSSVRSLAAAEGIVHIGLEDGRVAQVDMITGRLIGSVNVGAAPHDLAIGKGVLYAVVPGSLRTLPVTASGYGSMTSTGFSGAVPNTTLRHRLFKGSNRLYATHRSGFGAYNISTPGAPALLQDNSTAALGWGHLVATGSNLAVACLGANAPDDVSLYDLGANGAQANFLTTFATPGAASAVTIYNGLAYVADGTAGVQVVNFRAFDTLGQPPTVTLALETLGSTAEEGRFLPVIATATDDVQVRNVEFLVDGQVVDTDGNFPFEARVLTPRLVPGKTSFTVQARASDTGGNSALSNILTLDLTADTQSPSVLAFTPGNDALLTNASGFTALFTEPVTADSLNARSVYLWSAGSDGNVGTDDDVRVPVTLLPATDGSGTFRETASFQASTPLTPGRYRVLLAMGITDAKGNPLAAPYSSTFQVISGTDSDGDGIADNIESTLGLDPENQDSNGNGIPDGDEDFDADGLRNAWELRYGFDPRLMDSDSNGTNDNLEDNDKDTLNALAEQSAGSDPTKADTDGDGWPDQVEVEYLSNAADAKSKPMSLFVGSPTVTTAVIGGGTTISAAPVNVTLFGLGTTLATPPTTIRIGSPPP